MKINGADLDVLARRRLWQKYMDYDHGTGHGVGYFSVVHEDPCGIAKYVKEPFAKGMVISNGSFLIIFFFFFFSKQFNSWYFCIFRTWVL